MTSGDLSTEVYECFAKAAQGFPWLQSLLAGTPPDLDRLDTLEITKGLTVCFGATVEALGLIAERIDSQDG